MELPSALSVLGALLLFAFLNNSGNTLSKLRIWTHMRKHHPRHYHLCMRDVIMLWHASTWSIKKKSRFTLTRSHAYAQGKNRSYNMLKLHLRDLLWKAKAELRRNDPETTGSCGVTMQVILAYPRIAPQTRTPLTEQLVGPFHMTRDVKKKCKDRRCWGG